VPPRPRAAQPCDAAALEALDAAVNPSPWGRRRFDTALDGERGLDEEVLVLEERGQLVGYIVFARVLDECSIYNVGVSGLCRRRGFGACLVDEALARLRERGCRRCLLEVRVSNRAARELYASRGFRPDGVRKNYYPGADGREDALLMSRELRNE
tara:strand:+ start:378 stop:842 length:465 start_codon:yes stop_codon:yes gene_type:complete